MLAVNVSDTIAVCDGLRRTLGVCLHGGSGFADLGRSVYEEVVRNGVSCGVVIFVRYPKFGGGCGVLPSTAGGCQGEEWSQRKT